MPQPTMDEPWVDRLRSDDLVQRNAAIDELRRLLISSLKRTLSERYGTHLSIEDIVQESLLKILDSIDRFEGRSRFSTWAITVATRVGLTELRRRRYRDVSLDTTEGSTLVASLAAEPGTSNFDGERQRILKTLGEVIQDSLSERQRSAIRGTLDELPVEEIASRLGSSRNATYKLIHDARMRLRDAMLNAGITPDDLTALTSP